MIVGQRQPNKVNESRGRNKNNLKIIPKSNKLVQALNLPSVMNVNPRSIYNKLKEFQTFVLEENIDCIFMSESWERPDNPLDQVIDLPSHTVISNPHQRKGVGGRPALIINSEKYIIKNLTQSLIEIPWGVEATWALITPKKLTNNSMIKHIAVCSFYSKPRSRSKSLLLDHISQAFNIISAKYTEGLHFILAGDSNCLKLDNILNLSPYFRQMVTGVTRLNPPKMLDPVITTLSRFYQTPLCLPPLDSDPDCDGTAADHLIVVMRPVDTLNNIPARSYREVKVRPFTHSGMSLFRSWIEKETWDLVLSENSVNKKSEILQKMVLDKLNEYCPEKLRRFSSDDKPWFTSQLKKLDRRRRREYNLNRRSKKYLQLHKLFNKKVLLAKKQFKSKMIDDILVAKSSQWYSKLKRVTNYEKKEAEYIQVEQISQLSDIAQAEAIANNFSEISNQYKPLQRNQIETPLIPSHSVPKFTPTKVRTYLQSIKTNKSSPPGDIPAKIIKEFAMFLSIPVADIINSGISLGEWPKIYKHEIITPVPKQFPPETIDMLRPISNLLNLNKIMEKIVCEMIVDDMKQQIDKKQFGNQKHLGIQHYLIKMIHRIVTNLDNSSKGEVKAVLCLFIDYKQAFSRQDHTLGIKSFIANGVRSSLIPILMSYFEDREMRVKWHGEISDPKKLPGGGAMGATLGIWEYLSQTNNNSDCVPEEDRFKFVDDLSILEIINLLNVGLSEFDFHSQVPSDIPVDGHYLDANNLKSQHYLNEISEWSDRHQMIISQQKTKAMIFNYTNNYQFGTRLKLQNENIECVQKMKLLGTWVNADLTWDDNCAYLIKKVNSRMALIRSILSFGASRKEMVHFWITFCRSVLEQSCVVWHNSLTQDNSVDLERTQKSFAKLILKDEYENYNEALLKLNLHTLADRRENISLKFAKDGLKFNTLTDLIRKNEKTHPMKIRKSEAFNVNFSNTERMKKSSILYIQNLLNNEN